MYIGYGPGRSYRVIACQVERSLLLDKLVNTASVQRLLLAKPESDDLSSPADKSQRHIAKQQRYECDASNLEECSAC